MLQNVVVIVQVLDYNLAVIAQISDCRLHVYIEPLI